MCLLGQRKERVTLCIVIKLPRATFWSGIWDYCSLSTEWGKIDQKKNNNQIFSCTKYTFETGQTKEWFGKHILGWCHEKSIANLVLHQRWWIWLAFHSFLSILLFDVMPIMEDACSYLMERCHWYSLIVIKEYKKLCHLPCSLNPGSLTIYSLMIK